MGAQARGNKPGRLQASSKTVNSVVTTGYGCEFITIVSLLAHHFKYYSGVFRGTDNLGEDKPASGNSPVTENNPMSENCGNLV